jgi:hypothetical protein
MIMEQSPQCNAPTPEFAEEASKPYERFAAAVLDFTAITSDGRPDVRLCGAVVVLPLHGGTVSQESTLRSTGTRR